MGHDPGYNTLLRRYQFLELDNTTRVYLDYIQSLEQPRTMKDEIFYVILSPLLMCIWITGCFRSILSWLIIAYLPFSVRAVVHDPQHSPSVLYEKNYTLTSPSRDNDEFPPRTKNRIQGKTMFDWTGIIMFIGIVLLLLVVVVYHHKGVISSFCIFWIYIFQLMEMVKKMMKQAWNKLKENITKYLGAEFRLSTIAISSPVLGGPEKWKASMVAGIAAFAIIIYCGKVSVELKRAKSTALFNSETMNNKKVFFTATHVLEFLIPLLCFLLACVYLTGVDTKYHHAENDWGSVAFILQVFIHVIGGLLAFMNDHNPYYFIHNDQNQKVPMQPIDTIPCKGNEIFLKDKLVVAEEISEEVADVNVLVAVQGFVENECADGAVQGFVENECADGGVTQVIVVVAEEPSEEVASVHV